MKVVLAGAFGNLGAEILKCLCRDGHEVVAADLRETEVEGCAGKYTFRAIDATNPETMKGLCDGADVVITTVGLTGASTKVTSYDIDHKGNLNLYAEAKAAGVKKFNYLPVLCFWLIADYNKDTRLYDTVSFQSLDDLAGKIEAAAGEKILAKSTLSRILNNQEYNNYFTYDRGRKEIILKNNFRSKPGAKEK